MSTEIPKVREKFFMSSQGERLFTISIVAILFSFIIFSVSQCSIQADRKTDESIALDQCAKQPGIVIKLYKSEDGAPDNFVKDLENANETEQKLLDTVAKCRTEVLDYYTKKNAGSFVRGTE